jgi:radical SAM superfamily enzyme YgiQ (UPF0313 family)
MIIKEKGLDIRFVSAEAGITALGFRRMAAIARKLNPQTKIYFIPVDNLYSLLTHIFPSRNSRFSLKDAENVAIELETADLICFGSMTASSEYVENIIAELKKRKSKAFILWGGIHCTLYPSDAIKHADAICMGEGEISFEKFFRAFKSGKDYTNTQGMWFNIDNSIQKNPSLPLNTPSQLESFPHLYNDLDCEIYDLSKHKFKVFTKYEYVKFNGTTYRTIWSIGCPYECAYCANDSFISIDKEYRKIRYPSITYILEEIEEARKLHPYICTIAFYDDNFISIPLETIQNFAIEYKKRINLPFVVFGIHPNLITPEKIDILAKAGMNRARMGIQSGSPKILEFFHRPTSLTTIKNSVSILAKATKKYKMIPPAYDIISDNPIETKEDIIQTLKFLYELERPFTLTLFSLRIFPKTRLCNYFQTHPEIDITKNLSSYLDTRKTMTNIILYILAIFRPPRAVFSYLLNYVKGTSEQQKEYPTFYFLIKNSYLLSRAIDHIRKLDFTVIVGKWTYYIWKLKSYYLRIKKI